MILSLARHERLPPADDTAAELASERTRRRMAEIERDELRRTVERLEDEVRALHAELERRTR